MSLNFVEKIRECDIIFDSIHFTRVDPRDYYDEHKQTEIRELTIGTLGGGAVLVVCHTICIKLYSICHFCYIIGICYTCNSGFRIFFQYFGKFVLHFCYGCEDIFK